MWVEPGYIQYGVNLEARGLHISETIYLHQKHWNYRNKQTIEKI